VNWQTLTSGTPGALLAVGLTLAPLLAVLIQRRVRLLGLFFAPVVAVPAAIVASLIDQVLIWVLPARVTSSAWTETILGVGVLMVVGYATGIFLTRGRDARDAHKRGTVLIPVQRPNAGFPVMGPADFPGLDPP
jgi:hypothetical protein